MLRKGDESMSEFVQCFFILVAFLGFISALFCGYTIKMKDKDKQFSATKGRDNKKK